MQNAVRSYSQSQENIQSESSFLGVALTVADTWIFSAVHSDVSYAVPDPRYAWSETDTPEIPGKYMHLIFGSMLQFWCVLQPTLHCIITPHVQLCCMCKHSTLVQLVIVQHLLIMYIFNWLHV